MYKYLSIVLFLTFIFVSCQSDTPTEPTVTASYDPVLVGIWELEECKLNGNITSSENFSDCAVKIQFNDSGVGFCWKEKYGITSGCKSFSWSTTNDKLTIHEENEYPFVSTYVVVNNTCSLTFVDDGNVELLYTK